MYTDVTGRKRTYREGLKSSVLHMDVLWDCVNITNTIIGSIMYLNTTRMSCSLVADEILTPTVLVALVKHATIDNIRTLGYIDIYWI